MRETVSWTFLRLVINYSLDIHSDRSCLSIARLLLERKCDVYIVQLQNCHFYGQNVEVVVVTVQIKSLSSLFRFLV